MNFVHKFVELSQLMNGIEEEEEIEEKAEATTNSTGGLTFEPYASDLEYLSDQFAIIENRIKIRKIDLVLFTLFWQLTMSGRR